MHVALIGAIVGFAAYRIWQISQRYELPPLRDKPLAIQPLYDIPEVVTDEQLSKTLGRLAPRFHGQGTEINHVDHALRFWGSDVAFDDPKKLDGKQMRELLVNDARFAEVYGTDEPPLLIGVDSQQGARLREQEGNTSSSHKDHTIACLAEVGTAIDFPVQTRNYRTTFGDVVRQSLRDFSLNQAEYEWSALTYALLLPSDASWYTTEGQQMNFDRLAGRIMRQEMPQGVCFGNHRLFTLAIMLRIDELDPQKPMFSKSRRSEVVEYLRKMTALLLKNQHRQGFWNAEWPNQAPQQDKPSEAEGDRLADRILATGHALEWWAMAPREVHPPREVLVRAGQWLVATIDEMADDKIAANYTFLSHAGRALALWRGKQAADVELGP
jgi:hypothetical protein